MKEDSILLIGAGGHAKSCIDVIEQEGRFKNIFLIGKQEELGRKVLGYSVIATDNDFLELKKTYKYAFVAVGQIKNANTRIKIYNYLKAEGFKLPKIISPHAYVSSHAIIEEGSIVMHDVVINPASKIGRNCILNSKSLIEHDVVIEDNCHISTGAIVNGQALIKKGTFLGSNVTIREGVEVGENTIIGAGEIIKVDVADNSVVN